MKKVNDWKLVHRVNDRFDLTEEERSKFVFIESIQPVHLIDETAKDYGIETGTLDPTATSWQTMLTVPTTERWYLQALFVNQTGSGGGGNSRVTNIGILEGTVKRLVIHTATAATQLYPTISNELTLTKNTALQVYVSTADAGDEFTMYALVGKLKSFRS